ncbi:MAG: hypothetical protein JW822_05000 [Spirochaetales bacterium]|nr:hypothetical protein [Spirochaetales bacterium]
MKKTVMFIITVLLLLSFLACGQEGKKDADKVAGGDESTTGEDLSIEVTLTQALLDKYIKTLPPFVKRARELGEDVESMGAAWLGGAEIVALLKEYGWSTPEEFGEVHAKVWTITPWLMMSAQMEGQSDEMKETMLDQFEDLFKESDITEQEKQLLVANQDKLFAAIEAANQ